MSNPIVKISLEEKKIPSTTNFDEKFVIDTDDTVRTYLTNNPTVRMNLIKIFISEPNTRLTLMLDLTFKEKVDLFFLFHEKEKFADLKSISDYFLKKISYYKTIIDINNNALTNAGFESLTSAEISFLMLLFKRSVYPAYLQFYEIMKKVKCKVLFLGEGKDE